MLGEGSLGEVALGESPGVGVAIIPEVVEDTKQLVLVVELDLLLPTPAGIETAVQFSDGTGFFDGSGWVE